MVLLLIISEGQMDHHLNFGYLAILDRDRVGWRR